MFNVVIVDDEKRIVKKIQKYCEELKEYNLIDKIEVETNSEKFYDVLEANKYKDFNLFLLDIEMPIPGDKLAVSIKRKYPTAKIIFISGYDKRLETTFDNKDIITDVIEKPISRERLHKVIRGLYSRNILLKNVIELETKFLKKEDIRIKLTDLIGVSLDRQDFIIPSLGDDNTNCKIQNGRKDISHLFPNSNSIAILTKKGVFKFNSSITGFLNSYLLGHNDFLKISQDTIVNINEIEKSSHTTNTISLKNDLTLTVSRSCKSVFKEIENHLSRK